MEKLRQMKPHSLVRANTEPTKLIGIQAKAEASPPETSAFVVAPKKQV